MQVKQLEGFRSWLESQTEPAKGFIVDRLTRIQEGTQGIIKPLGKGLSEIKVNYGPGYRLYCWVRGDVLVILLCGGDDVATNIKSVVPCLPKSIRARTRSIRKFHPGLVLRLSKLPFLFLLQFRNRQRYGKNDRSKTDQRRNASISEC